MEKDRKYYIGYELGNRYAQIAYFHKGMKDKDEPVSLREDPLKEQYRIETVISRESPDHPWVIGKKASALDSVHYLKIYHLYQRALKKEECEWFGKTVSLVDLLAEFIKKSLEMIPGLSDFSNIRRITFTVDKVDLPVRFLIKQLMEKIKIPWEKVILIENLESFFCYTFARNYNVWNQDVCLFEYQHGILRSVVMEKDEGVRPVIVRAKEKTYQSFLSLELGENDENEQAIEVQKDHMLYEITEDLFKKRNISYIFLIGDGFDGDWMKKSKHSMLRRHKAFIGKNLYVKGACYRSIYPQGDERLGFLYFGENKIQNNVGLKLENYGKEEIVPLISAGEDWFDMENEFEVILKSEPWLELTFQFMEEKEERTEKLPLDHLPKRPAKTTRLKIQVIPYSPEYAKLRITDLGFGELYLRTEKIWEFMLPIQKYFKRIEDIF